MEPVINPYVFDKQNLVPAEEFAMRFTSTPRGARLARRMVSHRLDEWGHPYDSAPNETLTLLAAELAANAVRHGHVPGRDFHLRLTESAAATSTSAPSTAAASAAPVPAAATVLRVEVTDTRTERRPPPGAGGLTAPPDAESGRGLYLVSQLADAWGLAPRAGAPGKCVWAAVHAPVLDHPVRGGRDGARQRARHR